jgi:hypothetical protein
MIELLTHVLGCASISAYQGRPPPITGSQGAAVVVVLGNDRPSGPAARRRPYGTDRRPTPAKALAEPFRTSHRVPTDQRLGFGTNLARLVRRETCGGFCRVGGCDHGRR